MAAEGDSLSNLADNVLCNEILSKLSLRDAVRTSVLSTRWPSLWTKTPHLHFSREFFAPICRGNYIDIIDSIFQQHSALLTSFRFELSFHCKSNTEKMKEWIECTRVKEVKEISITSHIMETVQVPATLFACQTLTALKLEFVGLNGIPESCLGFPCLVSCCLHFILETNEIIIEKLIALCPQLENLEFSECVYGLENLKICGQHLKCLKVLRCCFQTLILDCPQLMQLELRGCHFVDMERDYFCGLSAFKVNCPTSLYDVNVSDYWMLQSLSAAKTMSKVSVGNCKLPCVFSFLNTLSSFANLENLTIRECSVEKSNMAPGREMESGSYFNFPNIKDVSVEFGRTMTDNEVDMLRSLVGNAPSLQLMTITLPSCCPEVMNQILDLKKGSTGVEIRVVDQKLGASVEQ